MISYAEALKILLGHVSPAESETVGLSGLLGRTLASPVRAPHDMPLFDNSAVDGYGVLLADTAGASEQSPVRLKLAGMLQAGDSPGVEVAAGTAVKILTGAPVPTGVEAVVMQEFTRGDNGTVTVLQAARTGDNIRRRGEEFRQGDEVLPAGTLVTPPVIGLLASLGQTGADVYRPPRVTILVTGNELVQPGSPLKPGQIYESNSHALVAALQAAGCPDITVRHAPDDLESTREILAQALTESDMLITTGGVSVGEFDYVKQALADLNVETRFWKVAIKPGKPVYFGTFRNSAQGAEKLVFGLPGNPVAVLLTFYLFVLPALRAMQGAPEPGHGLKPARLARDLKKKPGRLDFVRGQYRLDDSGALAVLPTDGQGSHMLGGLARADCLIRFEREESLLSAGAEVQTIPLNWRPA